MDFEDTPAEAAFRAEARAWLKDHAPKHATGGRIRAAGSGDADLVKRAKAWQAEKADAGWACLHWPKAYGGRGASPIERVIWEQEEAGFDVPRGVFEIGLGMCGPTLMQWGSDAVKARYLPKMLRGEEIWCQLFSEPSAGSDVAGLRSRAVRDGEDWIINGQKIWTSGAHFSDFGILVVRSDPSVPKHKGLSFFFIDMKSPGVEVRPIKQISGASHFNEVFFTDLRVPDANRLGAVGQGWEVSISVLMNERLAVGDAPGPGFDEAFRLARAVMLEDGPAIEDDGVRQKLADWYIQAAGLKYTKFRTITALSRGQVPGPEASITKLVSASALQQIAGFGMDLQEMGGVAMTGTASEGLFEQAYLYAPGLRIAGGTDEILRNIIAERVLGLPADIRVDKDVPFDQLNKA